MTDEEMKVAMLMAIRGENTSLVLTPEQFKIATQMRADEVMSRETNLSDAIAELMELIAE